MRLKASNASAFHLPPTPRGFQRDLVERLRTPAQAHALRSHLPLQSGSDRILREMRTTLHDAGVSP